MSRTLRGLDSRRPFSSAGPASAKPASALARVVGAILAIVALSTALLGTAAASYATFRVVRLSPADAIRRGGW